MGLLGHILYINRFVPDQSKESHLACGKLRARCKYQTRTRLFPILFSSTAGWSGSDNPKYRVYHKQEKLQLVNRRLWPYLQKVWYRD